MNYKESCEGRSSAKGDTRIIESDTVGETSREEFLSKLQTIYKALQEKGYDPVQQISYFLLTGEPAYITAHRDARALTSSLERDEVVEELVRFYVQQHPEISSQDGMHG